MKTQTLDELIRAKALSDLRSEVVAAMKPIQTLINGASEHPNCEFYVENRQTPIKVQMNNHNLELFQKSLIETLRQKREQIAVEKFLDDTDFLKQQLNSLQ